MVTHVTLNHVLRVRISPFLPIKTVSNVNLVDGLFWIEKVAGSNPVSPTKFKRNWGYSFNGLK